MYHVLCDKMSLDIVHSFDEALSRIVEEQAWDSRCRDTGKPVNWPTNPCYSIERI